MSGSNSQSNSLGNTEEQEIEVVDTPTEPETQETGVDKPVQKSLKFDGWLYRQMCKEMADQNITDFTAFTLNKVTRSYQQAKRIRELEKDGMEETLRVQAELRNYTELVDQLQKELSEKTETDKAEIEQLQIENAKLKELVEDHTWIESEHLSELLNETY